MVVVANHFWNIVFVLCSCVLCLFVSPVLGKKTHDEKKKKFNEKDTTVLLFAGDRVCIVGRSNGVQMHLDCKDDTIFDWIASCLKSLNRANALHC